MEQVLSKQHLLHFRAWMTKSIQRDNNLKEKS